MVPEPPARPQHSGRRRHGDHQVLATLLSVATTGCIWAQLPLVFGPAAHRRFTEWPRVRVWTKPHRLVLDELGFHGELDWSRCAIDSVNRRVLEGGSDRPKSCRSGQEETKIHLIAHRTGLPLAVAIFGPTPTTAKPYNPWWQGSLRSARVADPSGANRPSCTATRATPTPTCAAGTSAGDRPPPGPQRREVPEAVGQAPVAGRTHHSLAGRIPPPAVPLRAQSLLPDLRQHPCTLICYRRLPKGDEL